MNSIEKHPENNVNVLSELLVIDKNKDVFINNFNIEECTNLMVKENIEKIRETNPDSAERLLKGLALTKDFQVKENEEFKISIKSKIKMNLVQYQDDKRIFDKYFWIKQLYDWNYSKIKKTNNFKKYCSPN